MVAHGVRATSLYFVIAIGRHLIAAVCGFTPATSRTVFYVHSVYLDASFDAVSMMSGGATFDR
jgi:hypothetical protein